MIKKILTFTIMLFSVAVFAQEQSQAKKGPFLTNKLSDNWFISIGGGGQILNGLDDHQASFGDRISPAFDISVGKWITPAVGLRAQFAGIGAKGLTNRSTGAFIQGSSSEYPGFNEEKFSLYNLHGDVLWNISNTIAGYRSDRTWDFVPFVGIGFAHSWEKDVDTKVNEVAATVGLINEIRLSDAVNLNLEFRTMFVDNRIDGHEFGGKVIDLYTTTVGFTYNFPKRGFDGYEPVVVDYSPYTSKIADLEKKLADADSKAAKLAADLQAEKNKPEVVVPAEVIASPLALFFPIGQARLTDKDLINLANIADVIKKSGKTYKIIGSADSATGSKKRNQQLSETRANEVYKALVEKFGVKASQLEVIAKGDQDEPFDKPMLNRVVIVE